MGKVSKAANSMYELIERKWKEADPEKPTGLQASEAARLLWTLEFGDWPFESIKLTTGRRYTWAKRGNGRILVVNPDGHFFGPWQDLVHDLSHLAHQRKNPKKRPHCIEQARIERRMQDNLFRRILS